MSRIASHTEGGRAEVTIALLMDAMTCSFHRLLNVNVTRRSAARECPAGNASPDPRPPEADCPNPCRRAGFRAISPRHRKREGGTLRPDRRCAQNGQRRPARSAAPATRQNGEREEGLGLDVALPGVRLHGVAHDVRDEGEELWGDGLCAHAAHDVESERVAAGEKQEQHGDELVARNGAVSGREPHDRAPATARNVIRGSSSDQRNSEKRSASANTRQCVAACSSRANNVRGPAGVNTTEVKTAHTQRLNREVRPSAIRRASSWNSGGNGVLLEENTHSEKQRETGKYMAAELPSRARCSRAALRAPSIPKRIPMTPMAGDRASQLGKHNLAQASMAGERDREASYNPESSWKIRDRHTAGRRNASARWSSVVTPRSAGEDVSSRRGTG